MARILVIDDRPLDAAVAVRLLRENPDWETEQFTSGSDALDSLDRLPCDLVLTDLHMPEMDGLTVMREIHARFANLPVVVMTSRGSEQKAVKALEAGAASYVPKSRLESDLVSTCRRVLDSARLQRDQAALLNHLVEERFEISIENERRHVPALVDLIVGRCVQFRICDQSRSPRIGVAIEEAVVNAMIHGNLEVTSELRETSYEEYEATILDRLTIPEFAQRRVTVVVVLDRNACRVTVRDEGPGFDPDGLRDPTDPENLCRVSGRGILLMRTFLDVVQFNGRGNEVLLVVERGAELPDALADLRATSGVSSAG